MTKTDKNTKKIACTFSHGVCACARALPPNIFNQLGRPNFTYAEGLMKILVHFSIL